MDKRIPSEGMFCVLSGGLSGIHPNTLEQCPPECTLILDCRPSITFSGGSQLAYLSEDRLRGFSVPLALFCFLGSCPQNGLGFSPNPRPAPKGESAAHSPQRA